MHDVLNLLVNAFVEAGDIPIVGGNFNACLGSADTDDLPFFQHGGPIGMGQRNARNTMLIHWILQNKLYIFNRDSSLQQAESWMCRRALDGAYVHTDFILGDAYFNLLFIPIGNNHKCAHCLLSRKKPYKQQYRRKQVLKGWKPFLDESGQPTGRQSLLETAMGEQNTYTLDVAEIF